MVPPSVIRIASTHANTGRSMKNCGMAKESIRSRSGSGRCRDGRCTVRSRLHLLAGRRLLNAGYHHARARFDARQYDPVAVALVAQFDALLGDLVLAADHVHVGAVVVALNR